MQICVIDRVDGKGHDVAPLQRVSSSFDVQRISPHHVHDIRPNTEVLFIRAAYFGELGEVARRLPRLRWIHISMAGTEHLPKKVFRERGIILTNSAGVLDQAIGEYVAGSVLLWSKGLLRSAHDTSQALRVHREPLSNDQLRVLVVGAGGIGTAAARMLRGMGVAHLAGARRDPAALDPVFDEYVDSNALLSHVGNFNVLVASLPSSPATANMFSSTVIAGFADPCVFVNVGRGASVDHHALARMLSKHTRSAAVLDVTEPEPLPSGHPLWGLPNLVISPHMAGDTPDRHERYALLFEANLGRFSQGEPLLNRVI
ncbi:NAD(P)-dependent oxidoreductase [Brevibacterium yomogidense]|uniref:NAD(P)-dependent oxidoreductase n=1 Tax=Brevibacterium yomogidense TaxID=946573 RepID=UPI001E43B808|nr:NAD(P)-dependent oxidoreductase [Brevibacterium yomogidense]